MKCPFDNPPEDEVFIRTKKFYGIYNLKPIVPGHVMIIPNKHKPSLMDLNKAELTELFETCKKALRAIAKVYKTNQFNLAIQEGKDAGQSVNHLHVHLLPREKGDFNKPWIKVLGESHKRAETPKEERVKQTKLLETAIKKV